MHESIGPSFLLLVVGLLLFLASALQLRLWMRGLIWLGGIGLLGAAYGLLPNRDDHYGLVRILLDALQDNDNSVLAEALVGNWTAVAGNLPPMFDIMLLMAALVAFIALVAFTPGQWVERVLRPVAVFLIGAIVGGIIVVVIAASGLGGYAKARVYAGVLEAEDVIDGDTLRFGDVTVRLWGIDAPEYHSEGVDVRPSARNQFCFSAAGLPEHCGAKARGALADLVDGRLVSCAPPPDSRSNARQLRESFGRPLVQCVMRENGVETDLARALAEQGHADAFRRGGDVEPYYSAAVEAAKARRAGMWAGRWPPLSPDQWRNNDAARDGFIEQLEAMASPG